MFTDAVNNIMQGVEQGIVSPAEIESLQKALTAGYGYAGAPTELTHGGVLQTESLEAGLKSITFDMKNLKFWPAITIDKANNLFETYNRLVSYGGDSEPYMGEGGAPQEEDSTYVRDGQRIVFFGTRRKVSHQMTLVRTSVGDAVEQQSKEGTMHLLKKIERELYWGHSHFVGIDGVQRASVADLPASSISMNGLLYQIKRAEDDAQQRSGDFEGYGEYEPVVKSLDGRTINQDDVEELAVVLLENFSAPSEIHLEPKVLSSFVRQFYPQFRSEPGLANQTVGYDVSKVQTSAGTMDLKPNLFLKPRDRARPKAVNKGAPSIAGLSVTGAAQGAATGKLAAGDYIYKVTFVNDFGESSPIEAAPVTAVADDSIDLTIAGAIPAEVKYMRVYRTAPGGAAASARFIGNYKNGIAVIKDINDKLPGLGEAFMLDMSADVMKFKQLCPLSKLSFAVVTTALEFAIVLYGSLVVFCPRFLGAWQNVGK